MPTAEGRGFARQAWAAYEREFNKRVGPSIERAFGPSIKGLAASMVADRIGFWCLWHMYGGFDGLQELGFPRTTIFRKVAAFRKTFGAHPDEYVFEGITIEAGNFAGHVRSAETP